MGASAGSAFGDLGAGELSGALSSLDAALAEAGRALDAAVAAAAGNVSAGADAYELTDESAMRPGR